MQKYSKEHLWIEEISYEIGVTSFITETLGGIEYFNLPSVNEILVKSKTFGSFESAKMAMELIAPVSGRVVAVNPNPHNSDWLIKVADVTDKKLLSKEEYDELVAREFD